MPASLQPVLQITGPAWKLTEIGGTPVVAGSKATLDFLDTGKPDSRVSGNGSCNKFGGKSTITGGTVHFSPLRSTKMACASELNAQETKYLEMLQAAERWELRDRVLTIFCKGSDKPLRFVE